MNISVLGAGTWGSAIARHLSKIGHTVTLWSALPAEIDALSQTHIHPNLPFATIPDSISLTKSLIKACDDRDMLVFAVPSVFVRATARAVAEVMTCTPILVDLAKGIEDGTYLTMTQIIEEEMARVSATRVCCVALSGPTHAEEVARDLPTAIVSAGRDPRSCIAVREAFTDQTMRVYTSGDVMGVEICGALKNIMALAAGISAGIGYGDNAKAAIITRGMAEIARLGRAMGCNERTFWGLSGIGDLIVTATSEHSRNNRCGRLIGQGMSAEDAKREVGMVVEGLNALPAAVGLATRYGVDMPIVMGVDEIVNHGTDPAQMVAKLMTRESKNEALDA